MTPVTGDPTDHAQEMKKKGSSTIIYLATQKMLRLRNVIKKKIQIFSQNKYLLIVNSNYHIQINKLQRPCIIDLFIKNDHKTSERYKIILIRR